MQDPSLDNQFDQILVDPRNRKVPENYCNDLIESLTTEMDAQMVSFKKAFISAATKLLREKIEKNFKQSVVLGLKAYEQEKISKNTEIRQKNLEISKLNEILKVNAQLAKEKKEEFDMINGEKSILKDKVTKLEEKIDTLEKEKYDQLCKIKILEDKARAGLPLASRDQNERLQAILTIQKIIKISLE